MVTPLLFLLAGPARAADAIATLPGRAVVVLPCEPDPTAACWGEAMRFERFAPPPRVVAAPKEADVKVAWKGNDLLVNVVALPEASSLEVSISPTGIGNAAMARIDGPKVVTLRLGKAEPDAPRSLWLNVIEPGLTRPWAPVGTGDLQEPMALVIAKTRHERAVAVERTAPGTIALEATGAAKVSVRFDRPEVSRLEIHNTEAWSATGTDRLADLRPPEPGWYEVEATWMEGKALTDLVRRRFYFEPPPVAGALAYGIHPEPRTFRPGKGKSFTVGAKTTIGVTRPELAEAGRLLAEEIARFTGFTPKVVDADKASIVVALADEGALPEARVPDGFQLDVQTSRAVVSASGLRGAVYGVLALADAIGPDGATPPFVAGDQPALEWRILHLWLGGEFKVTPEGYAELLRKVIARGRYNLVVLDVIAGGYQWQTHPELTQRGGITPDDVRRMVKDTKALGFEVAPGTNAPGHAGWILASHPELTEDWDRGLLCTRHPETYPLLAEVYDELLDVFDHPTFFQMGHDEAGWRTNNVDEDVRCPRCAGTPRWALFGDDLAWHLAYFKSKGVRPIFWTDMLVEGFNGKVEKLHRSLEVVPMDLRGGALAASWAPLGDPEGALKGQGFDLVLGSTAFWDWKRGQLEAKLPDIRGYCLAIFYATPWDAVLGSATAKWVWSNIVLAGAATWRPALDHAPIDTLLAGLEGAPAFLPGFVAPAGGWGRGVALAIQGRVATSALPQWGAKPLQVGSLAFPASEPVAVEVDAPATIQVGRKVAALSFMQTTVANLDTVARITRKRPKKATGSSVGDLVVVYADGTEVREPIHYGIDTMRPDAGDLRESLLFGTSGSVAVVSDDGAQRLRLQRLDWVNPTPAKAVSTVRIETTEPGVAIVLAGALALDVQKGR